MARRAARVNRSDSGIIEIAPGLADTWWSVVQREATSVEYLEPLAGRGKYVALYRVTYPEGDRQLWAVTAEE